MTRAPIPLPGRTVIFDYGEVISLTPSAADRDVITRLAGVSPDSEPFWRAYFTHRDGLDQGSAGVAAYWQAIAGDVGASWDDARVHELWAADFRSWLSINPGTIEVLADLKAGDTRLALLSNAGPDSGSATARSSARETTSTISPQPGCGANSMHSSQLSASSCLTLVLLDRIPDATVFTHQGRGPMPVLMIAEQPNLDEGTYASMLEQLMRCCVRRTASCPTPEARVPPAGCA